MLTVQYQIVSQTVVAILFFLIHALLPSPSPDVDPDFAHGGTRLFGSLAAFFLIFDFFLSVINNNAENPLTNQTPLRASVDFCVWKAPREK